MQNSKIEIKKRSYVYAIRIIQFIDKLDKKDFNEIIVDKLLQETIEISKILGKSIITLRGRR